MTEELLTRIRKGIIEYKQKHAIKNNDVFAEHFIRSIAFSPKNPGFKLKEITKWKVLVEGDLGDVEILEFDTKDEAQARFDEEYPNGATAEAQGYLMYQAPADFMPTAGGQERTQVDLQRFEDAEAINIIIEKTKSNIVANITDILNNLKGENETGDPNNHKPNTLSEAVEKRTKLQFELEMSKANTVFGLIMDNAETGEKYIIPKDSWENQNMAKKGEHLTYPNLARMPVKSSKKSKSIGYSLLLELDRFLSDDLELVQAWF